MGVVSRIFETIYYAAIDMSAELAQKIGPYETYKGSPASQVTGCGPSANLCDFF